ncbi:hypothetical protein LTR37_020151, partial [Vermiconidia calcicola]
MQHHLYRIALDDRLFLAPLDKEKVRSVFDVGCGTGLWCIDVADEIPNAQVLGSDLSPIQPGMVPPNCKFIVDDCNTDWLFDEKFDLIHTRAMTPGMKDWPRYMRQAFDHLKPGGYIELHEIYIPICYAKDANETIPKFVQWSHELIGAGSKLGLDFTAAKKVGEMLQDAGFVDINVRWQNWPV